MNESDQVRGPQHGGSVAKRPILRAGAPLALVIGLAIAAVALWSMRAPAPNALPAPIAAGSLQPLEPAALRSVGGRTLRFETNLGQAAADARFVARSPEFAAEVFDDGVRVSRPALRGADDTTPSIPATSARLRFVDAQPARPIDARERAAGATNYLIGADSTKWLRNVPGYRQLRQAGLYPGIDLVYYGRDSVFEYDLVVQPGADPSRIRIAVASEAKPVIDAQGDLLLDGAEGRLRMHRPVLYQHVDGEKKTLEGDYVLLAANEVGFRLPAYDRSRPLVIDPTFKLLYSTYLGGVHDDQVGGIVLDAQNNAYVVGNSGSEDFPVSGNAYQNTRKAIGRYVRNVVVTKFDAAGTLVYSTFVGGTTNDYGVAIAVDGSGRASFTGTTNSPDFPVTANAYQAIYKGSQSAYLATLSSDGSALVYATFYGGNGGSSGAGVFVEPGGTLLVGGSAGSGLPTTAGAYKTTLATGSGAFVARFDSAAAGVAQLQAATYYGTDTPQTNFLGSGNYAYTVAVDAAGSPWLTGQAFTTNLPVSSTPAMASPTAMTPSCSPGGVPLNSFAYVAHLSTDLKTLVYASYLTGRNGGQATCAEYGHAIAFDAAGDVYVGGSTSSLLYPTTAGVPQPTSPANSGFDGYTGFITKLKGDGSAVLWSTYLGGNAGRTYMSGLLVSAADGALWSWFSTQGGSNFPITADAFQKVHGGGFDGAFARLDPANGALLYSSYLGGAGDEGLIGLAVDRGGNVRLAGQTTATNFPVTTNAFQPTFSSPSYDGNDWFFSLFGSGAISSVVPAEGGNGGTATLHATTTGLDPATLAELVGAGGVSVSATSLVLDAGKTVADIAFVLDGVAPGIYDLRLTQPDGTVLTRIGAFTVTAGGTPELSAQIIGRPKIRTGKPAAFEITVLNSGSVDAMLVPLWFSLPSQVAVSIDGFDVPAGSTNGSIVFADGRYYFFQLIAKVAAHQSVSIPFTVTAPSDLASIPMRAVLQAPWARTPADATRIADAPPISSPACLPNATNPAFVDCSSLVLAYLAVGERPLADVAAPPPATGIGIHPLAAGRKVSLDLCDDSKSAFDKGFEAGKNDAKNKTKTPNPYPWGVDAINWHIGHDTGVYTANPNGTSAARARTQAARDGGKAPLGEANCPVSKPLPPPPPPLPPGGGGGSGSGGSIDPNDKFGPMGDGSTAHYFRPGAMRYEIAFENQPTAALPAADVVVTDQLDPAKVDLATLSLGDIRFGTHTISVPPGLKSFNTVYAISATLEVRVQGSLDPATALLKWTFTTLDPATHLPPSDPTLGFLPPDSDGVSGQGYVGFTVSPKAGLADGTTISNQASIVFDANAAILTPTWVNTVDTTAPSSRVQSLAGRVGTMDFDVAWSGSDTGSGVGAYTVYVSDNGGPYVAWQTATKATSGVFTGTSAHSYAFFARSSDGAGNAEPAKAAAEATIAVNGAFAAPSAGGSGGGGCTIGGDGQRDASLPLLVLLAAALVVIGRRRGATRPRRAGD